MAWPPVAPDVGDLTDATPAGADFHATSLHEVDRVAIRELLVKLGGTADAPADPAPRSTIAARLTDLGTAEAMLATLSSRLDAVESSVADHDHDQMTMVHATQDATTGAHVSWPERPPGASTVGWVGKVDPGTAMAAGVDLWFNTAV